MERVLPEPDFNTLPKKRQKIKAFDIINAAIFFMFAFIIIFPFYNMLVISLVPENVFILNPLLLYPKSITFASYRAVFANKAIWRGYGVTLFEVFAGTAINFFVTVFAAYALSRRHFVFRNLIMNMIIFTMFFSGGMIPYYRLLVSMGFEDNLLVLILPNAVNTFNLLLVRNNFQAIPDSYEEAAKIDGANDFQILFKIILPMSLPILATVTLFYIVMHWNSWFSAYMFFGDKNLYTLQMVLRGVINQGVGAIGLQPQQQVVFSEGVQMASILFVIVPILFVYPFIQKFYIKGIVVGGLKG